MNAPVVAGDVIAEKYRVNRVVGRGSAGTVVDASRLDLPQRVTMELLLDDSSPALAARFLREARAAALLKGQHVARVLDVGQLDSGAPFIVTEHLEGRPLSELLRERGQLDLPEALDYVLQACAALAEAHAVGIVHRHLQPESLLLTTAPDGAALLKVLDLGVPKEPPAEGEGGGRAHAQRMPGGLHYLSPEQLRGSRAVDARADLWSLGAILYRLLTGQPPFDAHALADLVLRVEGAEPALPSALRSDVPPAVERIVLCCLEKDPARRPANVAELSIALAPFAPAASQQHAERAARLLGATLPPRPRGSLPTIGLGLNAGPRSAPRPLAGPAPSVPPPSLVPSQAPPDRGRSNARVALIAALASLIVILGLVAARSAARGEQPAPGEPPARGEQPAAPSPEATRLE